MAHRHFHSFLKTAILASIGILTFISAPKAQADIDNKGKEFIVGFTPNYPNYHGYNVDLHLTADVATEATINYPVNSPTFTTTVSVTPGNVTIVSLPVESQTSWVSDSVQNNAVSVTAAEEVVVYMINRAPATSDAALALPVDTLNTEYIISTYDEAYVAAEFVVVAPYDNTSVTITPSNDAKGDHPAGVPFTIMLMRGEGMLVQGAVNGANGGLTGSIVTSDKPVQVTDGNGCTQVPLGYTACDTLMEVAQPVQTWGKEALVVNLPKRPQGSIYRIIAAQDNTAVFVDGVTIGTVGRGGYLQTDVLPGSHVISGDKPIFVTQYMTGQDYPGATDGDPAMGNMIPTAQFLKSYTFSTVGGGQFNEHYLTLIVNSADVGTMTLDGSVVDSSEFSPIVGTNFFSAVMSLSEGTHTTVSNTPHGITVEGYTSYDSYLYPGGALFKSINPVGDPYPPVCAVSMTKTEKGILFTGSATDNRASEDLNGNKVLDEGEDLNGNNVIDKDTGIFLVELLPEAKNLAIVVDTFVPGTPVVNFSATMTDPNEIASGVVRATDGSGNTCEAVLSAEKDCAGVPGGTAKVDSCGVCNGNGSSCSQCTEVTATADTLAKSAAVMKTAKKLVSRTQSFGFKARRCGLSARKTLEMIKLSQRYYEDLKANVEQTFTHSQVQCAKSVCAEAATNSMNRRLRVLTQRIARVQKRAKLSAIASCHTVSSGKGDTRKRTDGYRDDVLSAIAKLPSAVLRCTE